MQDRRGSVRGSGRASCDRERAGADIRAAIPVRQRRLPQGERDAPGAGPCRALTSRGCPYYLKTDVVKFFPSVDHERLLLILSRRVADPRLLALLRHVIASGVGIFDEVPAPRAWIAHRQPDESVLRQRLSRRGGSFRQGGAADAGIRPVLRRPGAVRGEQGAVACGPAALSERLAGLGLRLHGDKTQLRPSRVGLKFLGFALGTGRRRVQQTALRRLNRRLRRWRWRQKHGRLPRGTVGRSMAVWRCWLSQANATGLWRAVVTRTGQREKRRRGPF